MPDEVKKPSKAEVFRARLTSTLILWAIVTGVFVSQNAWAFFGLVSFLTVAGALEFRGLFSKFPGDGCRTVGLLVGLTVALSTGAFLVLGYQGHDNYFGELAGLTTVAIFCFFVRFKYGIEGRQSVDAVGDGLLAFVYVPILFGCFVYRLIFLPEGGAEGEVPGAWLLLLMIAAAKFTDMGAYITGSLIGKNKMAPHLSPAKTWEGFFGALGFAQLAAWGVWALSGDVLAWIPPLHVGVLALLIGLVAVAGDLAESILKRSLEVKDSGSLMPGIGGILDLIDSLCFAAPVTYFYLLRTGLIQ
ncbi:MAG: phosphatidate cytidylyltransferase [Akkermansiaceae bacterium]